MTAKTATQNKSASTKPPTRHKPTKAELAASIQLTVNDVIAPNLDVLFCGINPGLYTAATGHHFARPGNRFWPALHGSGFTDRLLYPWEERDLLQSGIGITNVVSRTTATAAELRVDEYVDGGKRLIETVRRFRPRVLAVLGVGAYRAAFFDKGASLGMQDRRIGDTGVWVLPNPSGLNANYQLADLIQLFRELRESLIPRKSR